MTIYQVGIPVNGIVEGDVQVLSSIRGTIQSVRGPKFRSDVTTGSLQTQEHRFGGVLKDIEDLWRASTKRTHACVPVSYETAMNANDFLKIYAGLFSFKPEVSSFPSGEIEFDWTTAKGSLSVLIDQKNLYYAFKSSSGRRRKGTDPWDSSIVEPIKESIHFLYSND